MKNKRKQNNNDEPVIRHRFAVTGFEQRLLPNVPADFVFHQLVDVQAFGEAVDDIVCFEKYDPMAAVKQKKKKKQTPTTSAHKYGGGGGMKESQQEKKEKDRVVVFRRNRQTQEVDKPTPMELAKPGYCYFQTRCFGNGHVEHITTSFARVDKEFDPVTGKRGLITVCTYRGCAFTSTYEIEKLDNAVGCRYNLSWAMVPDGWRGSLYFWLRHRQLKRDVATIVLEEIEQVMRATERKYQQQSLMRINDAGHHQSSSSSTSSIINVPEGSTTSATSTGSTFTT